MDRELQKSVWVQQRSKLPNLPEILSTNSSQLYAITAGGIVTIIILTRLISRLLQFLKDHALVFFLKHILYPFVLHRHRFIGPWSRASFISQLIYWSITVLCLSYKTSELSDAGKRAGTLSLINLVPLYSGMHLSFLADLLGLSIRTYTQLHGSIGFMSGALASFHIGVALAESKLSLSGSGSQLFGLIGGCSLAFLLVLSLRFFRRLSYELFLRTHQASAGLIMYSMWRHTLSGGLSVRIYRYVMTGSLVITSLVQGCLILSRNLSVHQAGGRASITKVKGSMFIDVPLARPWKVRAGQYVNLWIPFFSMRSFLQSHPFMIVYWTEGTDGTAQTIYFLIQPQDGLTRTMHSRAYEVKSFNLAQDEQSRDIPMEYFYSAWISGPHGSGAPVGEYGSVLMVATGIGIAAQLPYLKELIWGFNHCETRTRRIHLVWQVDHVDDVAGAVGIINQLLKEDIKDLGYIFRISIYFAREDISKGGTHGSEGVNGRVFYHKGQMNLTSLMDWLMAGRCDDETQKEKERGKMLVTVSAEERIRDDVRQLVRVRAHQEVRLMELDFQPRNRFGLWEAMWKHIRVTVDRHYHSGAVHPAAKDKADVIMRPTRDPEIGLTKPGASLAANLALEAAARRRDFQGEGYSKAQDTRIRRLLYAMMGTLIGIGDDPDTLVDTSNDSDSLVCNDLDVRVLKAQDSGETVNSNIIEKTRG